RRPAGIGRKSFSWGDCWRNAGGRGRRCIFRSDDCRLFPGLPALFAYRIRVSRLRTYAGLSRALSRRPTHGSRLQRNAAALCRVHRFWIFIARLLCGAGQTNTRELTSSECALGVLSFAAGVWSDEKSAVVSVYCVVSLKIICPRNTRKDAKKRNSSFASFRVFRGQKN